MKNHHLAKFFAAALVLTLPQAVHSQVMIDSFVSHEENAGNSGSSILESITIANNSDRLLLVAVGLEDAAIGANSVTFDGTNLTEVSGTAVSGGNTMNAAFFYLANPTATTGDIEFTGGFFGVTGLGAWSLYNVDTANPFSNAMTLSDSSSSQTTGSVASGTFVASLAGDDGNVTFSLGMNSDLSATGSNGTTDPQPGSDRGDLAFSSIVTTGTGTVTSEWSSTGGGIDTQSLIAVAAIPEPSTAALALLAGGLSLLVGGRRRRND